MTTLRLWRQGNVINSITIEPAQKITGVGGNQAGISTSWYPFSSLISSLKNFILILLLCLNSFFMCD